MDFQDFVTFATIIVPITFLFAEFFRFYLSGRPAPGKEH